MAEKQFKVVTIQINIHVEIPEATEDQQRQMWGCAIDHIKALPPHKNISVKNGFAVHTDPKSLEIISTK